MVAGVGIALAANAIAAGLGSSGFYLTADLLWFGLPYALMGALAAGGYLGVRALTVAWTLETAAVALGWSLIGALDASFNDALAMVVAPGIVTALVLGVTGRRIWQAWYPHGDDQQLVA